MAALKSARPALPGSGKPHECDVCGRRLVDRRSLRQHVAAAHPVPAAQARADGAASTEIAR